MTDDWRTMTVVSTEVRAVEEALLEAMGAGDVLTLDRLLAEHYVHTGPSGEMIGKPETLRRFETRTFMVTHSELRHVRVLPYADTAVVVGESSMTVRVAEQVIEDHYRFTRMWHRTDTGWRLVATHVSRIGSGPSMGHPHGS